MKSASAPARPDAPCDLIMKGGITSGIVYPPAIRALSSKYRFRQIGGTSAGAIAAVASAAAEYGRQRGVEDSFEQLAEIPRELGKDGRLLDLFQPQPATRPLLRTLLALAKPASLGGFPGTALRLLFTVLPRTYPWAYFSGFLGGALLGLCAFGAVLWAMTGAWPEWPLWDTLTGPQRGLLVALVLVLALTSALLAVLYRAYRTLRVGLPANHFAFSTGMPGVPEREDNPALMPWLHGQVQAIAGRAVGDDPLTFGDLEAEGITLRTVTVNLSEQRPVTLPHGLPQFWLFKGTEIERIFPASIAGHLTSGKVQARAWDAVQDDRRKLTLPPGYYLWPEAADLPVIVAARMSLSFPMLLAAVPLYTVQWDRVNEAEATSATVVLRETHLLRHWFSDGGIASNFPVHFFDSWLPDAPTFAIDLADVPKVEKGRVDATFLGSESGSTTSGSGHDPKQVELGVANRMRRRPWIPLTEGGATGIDAPGSLPRFLGQILSTARNYRDVLQGDLPSYRDRIATIYLPADEGGLNLDMQPAQIDQMQFKGYRAGVLLRDTFDFDRHRWVRFRVLMNHLERELKTLSKQDIRTLQAMFDAQFSTEPHYPYRHGDPDWNGSGAAFQWFQALHTALQTANAPKPWFDPAPKPESTLSVTPEY